MTKRKDLLRIALLLLSGMQAARSQTQEPGCWATGYDSYSTEGCVYSFYYFECDNGVSCISNTWECGSSAGWAYNCWQ